MTIVIKYGLGHKKWHFEDSETKAKGPDHNAKTDKAFSEAELMAAHASGTAGLTLDQAEVLHSVAGLKAQISEKVKAILSSNLKDLNAKTEDELKATLAEAFESTLGDIYTANDSLLDPAELCTFYHAFAVEAKKLLDEAIMSAQTVAELRVVSSVSQKLNPAIESLTKELSAETIQSLVDKLKAQCDVLDDTRVDALKTKKALQATIAELEGLLDKYELPKNHEARLQGKMDSEIKKLPKETRDLLTSLQDWRSTKAGKEASVEHLVGILTGLRVNEGNLRTEQKKLIQEWLKMQNWEVCNKAEIAKIQELLGIDVAKVKPAKAEEEAGRSL